MSETNEVDYDEIMQSHTRKIVFGCGTLYLTTDMSGDRPTRIFMRVGKAGCCQRALLESIGRLLTLMLEYGTPIERVRHTLMGVRCSDGRIGPGQLSCVDAVARELKSFITEEEGSDGDI